MEQWWKNTYINRRNWILENVKNLSSSPREILVLLMIDYLNEYSIAITPQMLSAYCALAEKEIDEIVTALTSKGYLNLKVSKTGIEFSIAGVFSLPKENTGELKELFSIFEEEFGRQLSQKEYTYLNNWQKQYSRKLIIEALREALVAQKHSFEYIDRILIRMKRDDDDA